MGGHHAVCLYLSPWIFFCLVSLISDRHEMTIKGFFNENKTSILLTWWVLGSQKWRKMSFGEQRVKPWPPSAQRRGGREGQP